MKTIAIIAEYNPLHNGHLNQINFIKQNFGDDTRIIVVMSGNFVQRGLPACLDKYNRAELAIKNGISLVIELPAVFASSSASEFAKAAIKIISSLEVVDEIVCGAENAKDFSLFKELTQIINSKNSSFEKNLKSHMRAGLNYGAARELSLKELLPEKSKLISEILNQSNNILALEYLLAIEEENLLRRREAKSNLKIFFSNRSGKAENELQFNDSEIASATAIRNVLKDILSLDAEMRDAQIFQRLENQVPPTVLSKLIQSERVKISSTYEKYEFLALSTILSSTDEELSKYRDFNPNLINRLKNTLENFLSSPRKTSSTQIFNEAATRVFTLSRIRRAVLARLLKIEDSSWQEIKSEGPAFINILAADKNGRYLLKLMRKLCTLPITVKNSDLLENLNNNINTSKIQQNINLHADSLYKLLQGDFTEGIFAGYTFMQ